MDKSSQILEQIAREEAKKSDTDVYHEVFIDEINNELMQSVGKAKGDVVIVLMR